MFATSIRTKIKDIMAICIISLAVFYIYHQTFQFPFINFDDPVYVADNNAVKQGVTYESINWAFGIHPEICMYYQPVAWLSHMLDCSIFSLKPGRHHMVSVFLHLANSILLFILLKSMTGSYWKSALSAMIFAIHPVNVDAVAWIAERKTVLSAFFWLSATYFYVRYTKRPSYTLYTVTVVMFTFGLLTKPVMITFPCTLIVLDYWPLNRFMPRQSSLAKNFYHFLKEKIPLFIITALWFITPFLSKTLMKNETLPDVVPYSLRISNALVSYCKYIWKFYYPAHLSILYPYPSHIPLTFSLPAFFFLTILTIYFIYRKTDTPYQLTGWLWFAGTLFPTSGLVLGTLWPEMADRWAYIPYIGLSILTSWTLIDIVQINHIRTVAGSTAVVIFLTGLVMTAHKQTGFWQNSIQIFNKALAEIKTYHYLPHQNIATEYMKLGRQDLAREHLQIILAHEPLNKNALFNMGLSYSETREYDYALIWLKKAIEQDPGYTQAYLVAADSLVLLYKKDDALTLCEKALLQARNPFEIQFKMAQIESENNMKEKAEQRLLNLIISGFQSENILKLYADLLLDRNDTENAFKFYQSITMKNSNSKYGFNGMGICEVRSGNFTSGIKYFEKAISIDPTDKEIANNLQNALSDNVKKNTLPPR